MSFGDPDEPVVDDAPADPAPPAPDPVDESGVIAVRVKYPLSTFDSGVDGVSVLTNEFQTVTVEQCAQVLEAAHASRVTIEQEKP
jgi:hypothetical protein